MEKNKWGIRLILLLLLAWLTYLSSVNSVLAQQNEEGIGEADLFFVEEYMVTAAKRKQTVSESPSAVTVITEEDIRHSGATNVGELLRMVPGFEVVEFTPSDTGIGARGQNKPMSNGILVMVNGRSIYLDFYGTVFWAFTDISLESVKRIEIIRGPGSALYGANAFHGVVNIITKEPEDVQGDNLSLTGGNLNTHINAIHSGKYGELGYLLSAGWEQAFHREDGVSRRYPRERISLDYMLDDDSKIIF
ncbi:MAG: TonB-dependent receptor, partial [Deltaproteobacteria bacterium]